MNQTLTRISIVIGCLFVFGFAGWKLYTNSQQDKLYGAVLEYVFENNVTPGSPPIRTFFVQMNGQDPPDTFIERYKGHRFVVKPGSQGVRITPASGSGDFNMADGTTGEKGKGINFSRIFWLGLKPQVYAGGEIYVMKKQNGIWLVDYRAMMVL